jgi:hypothetical protein
MVNTLYSPFNGTYSLDFRDNARIKSITISHNGQTTGTVEVSFNSGSQPTTNDTNGVIAGCFIVLGAPQSFTVLLDESVDAGERVYLHVSTANQVRVFINTDAVSAKPSPRRR